MHAYISKEMGIKMHVKLCDFLIWFPYRKHLFLVKKSFLSTTIIHDYNSDYDGIHQNIKLIVMNLIVKIKKINIYFILFYTCIFHKFSNI